MLYTVTGASACIQLKKFNEAIAWCDKGLAVSFARILKYCKVNHHLTFFQRWICLFVCFFFFGSPRCDPASEEALLDNLAAGWEKEGELATTSLEFEYLHQKSRCEIVIGGDDIILTSLPLARVFQCLFTFVLVSASRWLVEIWQLSQRGVTGELGMEFKFQRRSCKFSFFFPRPPRRACSQPKCDQV